MSRLFEIIATYRSELTLLPTMILIFVLATVLCYVVLNPYRWVKYIPALVGIVLGLFNALSALSIFTTPAGLDQMWRGIVFFVAGCIALATAWIIAMLSSGERKNAKAKKKDSERRREEEERLAEQESAALEQAEMHQVDLELAQAVQNAQANQVSNSDAVAEAVDPVDPTAAAVIAGSPDIADAFSMDSTRVYRNAADLVADYEAHEEPVKVYEPRKSKEMKSATVPELGHATVKELDKNGGER